MKYLYVILLIFTTQARAAEIADVNKQELTAQQAECADFSQVGFKDRGAFTKYLDELKAASRAEDFAKLVTYPLRVNKKPKPLIIKDTAALKQNFGEIFSDKTLEAIRKAEPKDNFCNYQGMTIANGKVWIDKKNGRTGIFVINP